MRRRRAVVVAAVLLLASCGVPTGGATRSIDPTEIPYGLVSPSSSPSPAETTTDPQPTTGAPQVFFLDADAELNAVALDTAGGVQDVLDRLAEGPSADERADGLLSALGPDVELQLRSTQDGVAAVEVVALSQDPSADRLPLAVGQIVLSVTSVPGIEGVRLQRNGVDREVPLPGGALTSRVLTAADYLALASPPSG